MFCVATAMLLLLVVAKYRFLLIKPSMVVAACFHVQVQWAATVLSPDIERYLPQPYDFFVLAQVFPLVVLAGSFFLLHRRTADIYSRITEKGIHGMEIKVRTLVALFGAVMLILMVYLMFVPLAKTGIYAILLDPLQAKSARESSLKLLDSALLRYAFSLLKSALAPLLCVLSAVFLVQNLKKFKPGRSALAAMIILFTMVAVSLPGARMPAAMLIVTIIFALFTVYKMPLKLSYLLPGALLVMGLPVMFTIFREGQGLDLLIFLDYLKGGVFNRAFVVPMETGMWHVHYAQQSGFIGVSGIPKLAEFLAVEPVTLGNIIYLKYSPYRLYSGLSNTSFVFAYYACFGMVSMIFSVLATWALDFSVLVMEKVNNTAILLGTVAAIVTSSFWFVSTMYTTALITNGFIFILIFALLLDYLVKFSLASGRSNT